MTQLKFKSLILIIFYLMKNHMEILIYDISYKICIGAKTLRIRCDKVDGTVKVDNGTRYLVLFDPEKYDAICNRIRYLISQKSGITYVFSHNYARIKIDSNDFSPLEKTLDLHNVIILIKSILNTNQNRYYYNIFLQNCLYQLPENNDNK